MSKKTLAFGRLEIHDGRVGHGFLTFHSFFSPSPMKEAIYPGWHNETVEEYSPIGGLHTRRRIVFCHIGSSRLPLQEIAAE